MLDLLHNHLRRHHVLHLVGAQLSLVIMLTLALAVASATAWPAQAHLRAARLGAAPRAAMALGEATSLSETAPAAPTDEAGVIRLQDLSPEAARLWNASHPIAPGRNPPAKPFNLQAEGVLDEARAVDCMTAAIYYEAANESTDGQRAVAQVVINRMRHPAFPKTICGVVFQGADRTTGCQFTFTCDGSLARKPSEESWARARKVAEAALHGYVMKKVGNATHYHADYVAPYWSPTLVKVQVIGAHIFYRWTGGMGLPPAFGGRYAGGEMKGLQIATLDNLARGEARLAAPAAEPPPAVTAQATVEEPAPAAVAAADAQAAELVTAASVAKDAQVVAATDLDWQGRPKSKGPPRLALPSATKMGGL